MAAVQGVASDLPQVRAEERAAVMEDLDPRVIDDAFLLAEDNVRAEDRVLAGHRVRAFVPGAVALTLLAAGGARELTRRHPEGIFEAEHDPLGL